MSEDLARIEGVLSGLRAGGAARRTAVEQLYKEYAGRLRRYFVNHRATPAEAEDRLQEVFVRILRSVEGYRGEAAQFAGWLWTIARNILIDATRRSGQGQVDLEDLEGGDELASAWPTPEESLTADTETDCVRKAIQRFNVDYPERAQCVSWMVSDHLSVSDLAGVLGRTPGATREFLSQCRKKLRAYLDPCFGGEPLTPAGAGRPSSEHS
jgi:RNA polymerase sigma factor (sigma-70 family)